MLMTKEYILKCLDKYCDFDCVLHKENFEEMVVRSLKREGCFFELDLGQRHVKGCSYLY